MRRRCVCATCLIVLAILLSWYCRGVLFVCAHEERNVCCDGKVQGYLQTITYFAETTHFIIEESDRGIKDALENKDYARALSLAQSAAKKLVVVKEQCEQLNSPEILEQFHRKRIEFHMYQNKIYESFLENNCVQEFTNRRMVLVAELQSLETLKRLCGDHKCSSSFIEETDNSIEEIKKILNDAPRVQASCVCQHQAR